MSPAATLRADSTSKRPRKIDKRRKIRSSSSLRRAILQSSAAASDLCRSRATRLLMESNRMWLSSLCARSAAGWTLRRAATSSMASGMPSSCREILARTGPSDSSKAPAPAALARSTSSSTDGHCNACARVTCSTSGVASADRRRTYSPGTRSASRLVARMRKPGSEANKRSIGGASESTTCSQLSINSRMSFPAWPCATACIGSGRSAETPKDRAIVPST